MPSATRQPTPGPSTLGAGPSSAPSKKERRKSLKRSRHDSETLELDDSEKETEPSSGKKARVDRAGDRAGDMQKDQATMKGDLKETSNEKKKVKPKRRRKKRRTAVVGSGPLAAGEAGRRSISAPASGGQVRSVTLSSGPSPDMNEEHATAIAVAGPSTVTPALTSASGGAEGTSKKEKEHEDQEMTYISSDKGKAKAKSDSPAPVVRVSTPTLSTQPVAFDSGFGLSSSSSSMVASTSDSQSSEIARLKDQLAAQSKLLERHQTHFTQHQQALTCQICLDLMYKPYALTPCGHITCYGCLVRWFTAPQNPVEVAAANANAANNVDADADANANQAPNDEDEDDLQRILNTGTARRGTFIRQRKNCPVCRAAVHERPVEMWGIKGMVGALVRSELADLPVHNANANLGANGNVNAANGNNANNDPWRNIFRRVGHVRQGRNMGGFFFGHHLQDPYPHPPPPLGAAAAQLDNQAPQQLGWYDAEDGGIYRCIDCYHEIWDGVCTGCNRAYPGHGGDEDDDDDDDDDDDGHVDMLLHNDLNLDSDEDDGGDIDINEDDLVNLWGAGLSDVDDDDDEDDDDGDLDLWGLEDGHDGGHGGGAFWDWEENGEDGETDSADGDAPDVAEGGMLNRLDQWLDDNIDEVDEGEAEEMRALGRAWARRRERRRDVQRISDEESDEEDEDIVTDLEEEDNGEGTEGGSTDGGGTDGGDTDVGGTDGGGTDANSEDEDEVEVAQDRFLEFPAELDSDEDEASEEEDGREEEYREGLRQIARRLGDGTRLGAGRRGGGGFGRAIADSDDDPEVDGDEDEDEESEPVPRTRERRRVRSRRPRPRLYVESSDDEEE